MTILSDHEIMECLNKGDIKISPFEPKCLNPAGYDLRSLCELSINPKQYVLAATVEKVKLSLKVLASLHLRSSFAREGVIGSFAVVDPGFCGQLTLALHNNGKKVVKIQKNERITQIVFHKLGRVARRGYHGLYQKSVGVVESRRNADTQQSII